jgi:hypothetical protein
MSIEQTIEQIEAAAGAAQADSPLELYELPKTKLDFLALAAKHIGEVIAAWRDTMDQLRLKRIDYQLARAKLTDETERLRIQTERVERLGEALNQSDNKCANLGPNRPCGNLGYVCDGCYRKDVLAADAKLKAKLGEVK